jgi:hypothetical protein
MSKAKRMPESNLDSTFTYLDMRVSSRLANDTEKILEECKNNKCESRSLHITCGFPAANPSSNLNAYCNELKHYIRCAKCKTLNCDAESSIVSIRKHLKTQDSNFEKKCYNMINTSDKPIIKYSFSPSTRTTYFSPSSTKSLTNKINSSYHISTLSNTFFTNIMYTPTSTTIKTTTTTTSLTTISTTSFTTISTSTSTTTTTTSSTTTTRTTTLITSITTTTIPLPTTDSIKTTVIITTPFTTTPISNSKIISTTKELDTKAIGSVSKITHLTTTIVPLISTPILDVPNLTTEIKSDDSVTNQSTSLGQSDSSLANQIRFKNESSINLHYLNKSDSSVTTSFSSSSLQVIADIAYIYSGTTSSITSTKAESIVSTTNKIETKPIKFVPLTSKLTETYPEALPLSLDKELIAYQKINSVSISFDYIDSKTNSLEAITENKSFQVKIVNRTEIFKGIN